MRVLPAPLGRLQSYTWPCVASPGPLTVDNGAMRPIRHVAIVADERPEHQSKLPRESCGPMSMLSTFKVHFNEELAEASDYRMCKGGDRGYDWISATKEKDIWESNSTIIAYFVFFTLMCPVKEAIGSERIVQGA